MKKIFGIAAVLSMVALVGGCESKPRETFNEMFSDYASESWCTIAEDGSWMELDTNPDDLNMPAIVDRMSSMTGKELDELEAYMDEWNACEDAIKQVNEALGFDDSLNVKMDKTTDRDGTQYESNDKYEVSWSWYSYGKREVLYTIKD